MRILLFRVRLDWSVSGLECISFEYIQVVCYICIVSACPLQNCELSLSNSEIC